MLIIKQQSRLWAIRIDRRREFSFMIIKEIGVLNLFPFSFSRHQPHIMFTRNLKNLLRDTACATKFSVDSVRSKNKQKSMDKL